MEKFGKWIGEKGLAISTIIKDFACRVYPERSEGLCSSATIVSANEEVFSSKSFSYNGLSVLFHLSQKVKYMP